MALATAPSKPGAFISEVVVQGIRRFGDVRRIPLAPGYNVLYGLSSGGKSTLFDVILSLLFARPAENELASFSSLLPQAQGACRAGMSLTIGGETFRVLKDYMAGGVTLSRLVAAEKRFDLVASESPRIQQWLSDAAQMTCGPMFGRLFTLKGEDLPSRHDAGLTPTRREEVTGAFEDRLRTMTLNDKRALLTKLSDEYRRFAEVKTSEFLQDGLRSKLFEVEAVLKKRTEGREKIEAIDLEMKDIAHVPKLPDGIDERIEAYRRQGKTREAELENLIPRQEGAHYDLAAVIKAPFDEKDFRRIRSPADMVKALLKKDMQFDGGLAMIVAGVICLPFGSPLVWLGLVLAAGGLALVVKRGLLDFLQSKEKFDALRKTVDQLDEQVKLMERKWEIETTVIRNLMKAYNTDDPREMKEIEHKRDGLLAKKVELEGKVAALALTSGDKDLDGAHAKITKQIVSIDERLQQIAEKLSSDPSELEPQIERLDRDVARGEGRRPTPRGKLFGTDDGGDEPGDDVRSSFTSVVETWCASRHADVGKTLRAIQDAFSKNARAISGNLFSDAQLDASGSVSARTEGRPPVPFEYLDGMGKDSCYLALRLTLFQLETRGPSRPIVLLDDPFDFEEGRLLLISRALRALGTEAQVIHLTSRPVHQRLADHQVEI